jgi:hypothetical protein
MKNKIQEVMMSDKLCSNVYDFFAYLFECKKNLKVDTVLIKKIETEIPFEFIDIDTEHFDSKAFQSDDRFFSTKKTIKRYSQDAINTEMQKALIGFNTTPEQIP